MEQARRAHLRVHGREIIGQSITTIIPPDRLAEEDPSWAGLEEKRSFGSRRSAGARTDGHPVSLTIAPICDEAGRIIGISKIGHDLSNMRRVNEELQRREAVLRSILDTIPDALVIIDERGVIQSFTSPQNACLATVQKRSSGRTSAC